MSDQPGSAVTDVVIEAVDVTRTFGEVHALKDVSLTVERGAVLGLLGHNGAGKSTLVHILATLLPMTGGAARVAGFDVAAQGHQVRSRIGLTGQYAAVDRQLSGRENIRLVARLLGATRREALDRADELLELFDLTAAADRAARTYSGGMSRRLDLAVSLVGRPEVIFLDEPTTGLDPTSRRALWAMVERLVEEGAAVLLTTQYLEEADRLADHIVVLSHGEVVASGTLAQLKRQVGERSLHLTLEAGADVPPAVEALRGAGLVASPVPGTASVTVPVTGPGLFATVVRALDDRGFGIAEAAFTEPTLDDVYLTLASDQPNGATR